MFGVMLASHQSESQSEKSTSGKRRGAWNPYSLERSLGKRSATQATVSFWEGGGEGERLALQFVQLESEIEHMNNNPAADF